MNGFEKRREEKKKQILHSLTDLVATRNLREIGVREIAERAGVSPASIYNFFGSKEELAKQVFYQVTEDAVGDFQQLAETDIPFKDKAKQLLELNNDNQSKLNSEGLKNFMFEDPDFRQHMEEYVATVAIPLFEKIIEQGKREGAISHGVSNRAIMLYFNAFSQLMGDPAFRESMDVELRKDFSQLLMYGLFGNPKD